ncbi:F0F1 ATP synthase subunit gamma [Thioclava atlantica]|uniref:H+transporting two-sector ATPase subunit gamma n=1 Tax=Thioclava atlantica TaxID=1317124 RepID=A0A085TZY9_9RHOB|nr:FoF1 ATP synthase subunit gamma [Thioclava atlantica]KFE36286.1 H+transporting two-sector ATPase subunit gamma [Thioclava atlantica]
MSERFADISARIETIHKLGSVIGAMRGIAASRVQEAHRHLDSIRTFAATIGTAIGEALAFLPQGEPPDAGAAVPERHALILFTAEQGFAGGFSEKIFEAARADLAEGDLLFLLGDRGLPVAEEQGIAVAWRAPMISHSAQAATLATRLADAIFARMAREGVTRVSLIHAVPALSEEMQIARKVLVPFDFGRFPVPETLVAPRITLPPGDLLRRLVEEYIFAELAEAVMLSFAAENEARMRAMIAAQDNTAQTLDEMIRTSRRLRQQEITEEIVELASAGLSAR